MIDSPLHTLFDQSKSQTELTSVILTVPVTEKFATGGFLQVQYFHERQKVVVSLVGTSC